VTIFRWVVGVFAVLMAVGSVLAFVIGFVAENNIWLGRARRFGHWFWLSGLFWFNFEVWGRVAWTLIHWSG